MLVFHRRAGKTVACIADLIDAALRCDKPEPRFAYIAPYYAQAKEVAWSYLKRYAAPIPGVQFHEAELRATLPGERVIRLHGADNYDRLRGVYFDGVILDEYGDTDPRAWAEVIRPALSDRQGWATFIGTPKGRNHFAEIWEAAASDPEWFRMMGRASETGLLPESELESARKSMSAEQYAAEYECSFQASVIGSYYGTYIERAERDKRIASVPHEPMLPVHTAWDLGIGDSTAIVMFQLAGHEIRVIDALENAGVGLDWYVSRLRERAYTWGEHLLPHDAQVRELGTGRSRLETLRSLGLGSARVLPAQSVDDGINAVRTILPRTFFDATKCRGLIEALRNYRRRFDDKRKAFLDAPLHDWTSHYADAMRYAAIGLNGIAAASSWAKPVKYSNQGIV